MATVSAADSAADRSLCGDGRLAGQGAAVGLAAAARAMLERAVAARRVLGRSVLGWRPASVVGQRRAAAATCHWVQGRGVVAVGRHGRPHGIGWPKPLRTASCRPRSAEPIVK